MTSKFTTSKNLVSKAAGGLRRISALAAFTVLVAAVTMAFADAPAEQTTLTFASGNPSQNIPPLPYLRLAKVPTKQDTRRIKSDSNPAGPGESKSPTASPASTARVKTVPSKTTRPGKAALSGTLNLNNASALQLTKLPGVGPTKASRIVQWRADHGAFGRVVDLRRVKGFGAKSVKKLLPYLTLSGKNTLR